jgi:hypothetical protein
MSRNQILELAEDNWQTEMGAAFPGERVVFRGKDLFEELGDLTWFQYLMFGITGKKFSNNEIALIEAIWSLTVSYPDPRLWNNRVAALAGTANSTGILGTSAAIACSEASIYGNQINIQSIDFIKRATIHELSEKPLLDLIKNELKQKRIIPGYGRPIVQHDERRQPLINKATQLNLASGNHFKTAIKIDELLQTTKYRMQINASGLAAALMADLGLSNREYYYYTILAFSAGIIPCHIDASEHKEGTFFPLQCNRINYTGNEKRHW